MVFGPQTIHRLPQMVDAAKLQKLPVVDVTFPEVEKFDLLPEPKVDGPAAFLSIMEGCSKYCSFCVVPYTRGEEVSRTVDSVMQEVVTGQAGCSRNTPVRAKREFLSGGN